MARPKKPLISRRGVIEAALKIIDDEGLDAFNLKRLATELNVHESSVYYHYRYKSDILTDVLKLVLAQFADVDVDVDSSGGDWKTYLLDAADAFYKALAAHPGVVAILAEQVPRTYGLERENQTAEILLAAGFPPQYVIPIREQLEAMLIGALQFANIDLFDGVPAELQALSGAVDAAREVSSDERFDMAVHAFIDGIDAQLARWKTDDQLIKGKKSRRPRTSAR